MNMFILSSLSQLIYELQAKNMFSGMVHVVSSRIDGSLPQEHSCKAANTSNHGDMLNQASHTNTPMSQGSTKCIQIYPNAFSLFKCEKEHNTRDTKHQSYQDSNVGRTLLIARVHDHLPRVLKEAGLCDPYCLPSSLALGIFMTRLWSQ